MNNSKPSKTLVQIAFASMITTLAISGLVSTLWSAEPKPAALPPKTDSPPSPSNSGKLKPKSPETRNVVVKKQLTGSELYSMHCNRCHPERYPTERTAAQWKTIMLHMQVRANLPGEQARMILKYLQENSGR